MGLKTVALEGHKANTLTAFYTPEGIQAVDIIGKVKSKGFQFAGPLLPKSYVRCGHMGLATTGDPELLASVVDAVQQTLTELNASQVSSLSQGAAANAVLSAMKE